MQSQDTMLRILRKRLREGVILDTQYKKGEIELQKASDLSAIATYHLWQQQVESIPLTQQKRDEFLKVFLPVAQKVESLSQRIFDTYASIPIGAEYNDPVFGSEGRKAFERPHLDPRIDPIATINEQVSHLAGNKCGNELVLRLYDWRKDYTFGPVEFCFKPEYQKQSLEKNHM